MRSKNINASTEAYCKTCGKYISMLGIDKKNYGWKTTGKRKLFFCSYGCMKVYQNIKK